MYPAVALKTAVPAKSNAVRCFACRRVPFAFAYDLTKSRLGGWHSGWLLVENLTRRTAFCIVAVYVWERGERVWVPSEFVWDGGRMGSAPRGSIDVWARGASLKLDKPVPRGRQVLSYSKSHIV